MSHFLEALFGNNHPTAQCELGSIGWEEDDEYFYPGESTNDGLTLVRVQLFRGRDFTKELSDRAQGVKLLCVLPDGEFRVPAKNARCYVMIPQGMDNVPGAGLIVATVGGGNEVHRNITAGDVAIAPTGADGGQALVLVKKDGSITLHATDNNLDNGNSVFLRVSPTAIQFVTPWGRMIFDASGMHWTTLSGARFDMGGIAVPGLPGAVSGSFSSYVTVNAATVKLDGDSVFLGHGSSYKPVVYPTLASAVDAQPTPLVTGPAGAGAVVTTTPLMATPNVYVAT